MAINNTPPPSTSILDGAPDTDKSVGFFNEIFGTGWQNAATGTVPTGGSSSVIFEMFFAFNAITLAAVTVLLFYVISAGIVGTAHEGESLGKRYSTLWTPIRSALAISLLMPLPAAKYSLLQALMLKFLFLSIGGADYLTNKVVDNLVAAGGQITAPAINNSNSEGLAEEILRNLVFQEYYKIREKNDYIAPGLTNLNKTPGAIIAGGGLKGFSFSAPINSPGKQEAMGIIKTVCSSDVTHCTLIDASSRTLVGALRPIAVAIVSQHEGGSGTVMDAAQDTAYQKAITEHATRTKTNADAAATRGKTGPSNNNKSLTDMKSGIAANGWAWLGAYYWRIAAFNEKAHARADTAARIAKSADEGTLMDGADSEIKAVVLRYHGFIEKFNTGRLGQRAVNGGNDPSGVGALFSSLIADGIGSAFLGDNTGMTGAAQVLGSTLGRGDPISNLQTLGHSLINIGTNMLIMVPAAQLAGKVAGAVSGATGFFGAVASWVPGAQPIGLPALGVSLASGALAATAELMKPLALALIMCGVTLAYYLPSMPFILWTTAVVGWLILTMELMVAAPIWAAMHAIPEGEGMAGQHGRQGYMLFLGILMRPSLHVMGFFMAAAIIGVIGHFVGESYNDYVINNANDDKAWGLAHIIAWLATIFIGCSLMIVLSHKAFSLVTWLPDNILRWAGGNNPSMGEANDEGKTSNMVGVAISRAQGAGSQAAQGAGNAIKGAQAAHNQAEKEQGALADKEKANEAKAKAGKDIINKMGSGSKGD